MYGLVTLFALAVYAALAVWIGSRFRGKFAKVLVAIVFIAIPTTDEWLGRHLVETKCADESRIVVLHTVDNVDAIYVGTPVLPGDKPSDWGYSIIEGRARPDTDSTSFPSGWPRTAIGEYVSRASTLPNGQVKIEGRASPPYAKYRIFRNRTAESGLIETERISVIDLATQSELGYFHWYNFRGGWVRKALGDHQPISCGYYPLFHTMELQLLHQTARPTATPPPSSTQANP